MIKDSQQLSALVIALEEYGTRRRATAFESHACYGLITSLVEEDRPPTRVELSLVRAVVHRKLNRGIVDPWWNAMLEPLLFLA